MTRRALPHLGLIASSLLLAVGVPTFATDQAANEVVYVADSATDQILKVNPDGTTIVVNTDAGRRRKLQGLVVRDTGSAVDLVVCDSHQSGGVFFYANAQGDGQLVTDGITLPDGSSLDGAFNVYLVSPGPSNVADKKGQVWKIPFTDCSGPACVGGYPFRGEAAIDLANPDSSLLDTKIVGTSKGSIEGGDLLVVSSTRVWLYPGAKACVNPNACTSSERKELIAANRFPSGTALSGIAQDPDGNLLVLSLGGTVFRYDPQAGSFLSPFASGLGNGTQRIVVGAQTIDAALRSRAFVTQRNAHKLLAFGIENGIGALDQTVTQGLNFPVGVGLGTGKYKSMRQGALSKVKFASVESTADKVTKSGLTDITCYERFDPRCPDEQNPYACDEGELSSEDLVPKVPHLPEVVIPDYVRGFQKSPALDQDPSGRLVLRICIAASSADFFRTIEQHEDEKVWLNNHPDCHDETRKKQPRFFWVPFPGKEPPIVENTGGADPKALFIDLSSRCVNTESNRAVTPDYSILLPAVGDTRSFEDIVASKFVGLRDTINFLEDSIDGEVCEVCPACDPPTVECRLRHALQVAKSAFEADGGPDILTAVAALNRFVAIIDQNAPEPPVGQCQAGAFNNCDRNVSGELVARAVSTRFFLCKINQVAGCPLL